MCLFLEYNALPYVDSVTTFNSEFTPSPQPPKNSINVSLDPGLRHKVISKTSQGSRGFYKFQLNSDA